MKSLISLTFIFLLHGVLPLVLLPLSQCSVLANGEGDLIRRTCRHTSPYRDLCESTLRSDPRSATADVPGLALIMVDKVKGNAIGTLNHIKELLKGATDPKLKQALSSCVDNYNAIVDADIPVAVESLTTGDYKFAVQATTDIGNETDFCERGFTNPIKSPLTDENKIVHDLATVAASITKLLL